ncbi:NADPH oxidase 3 [Grus japonensis]|uniref:NADPH oxidase 3 n=1 Tax=Grus japonensis TaxID=30415 RepID=A0ABC9WND6_GRUJA
MVAYGIAVNATIHIVAHLINIERYHTSQSKEAGELRNKLSGLGKSPNESYLNPIRTYETNTTGEVLNTIAGVTGVVITVALVLIITSSTELIRRSCYEVFWYSHHLFVVFFIGLIIHGMGVAVDGPYGSATTGVFRYRVSVCIAAGIGVTPFASILKSIWYKCCNPDTVLALQKVGGKVYRSVKMAHK